jgi:hypothetical protein
VAAAIEHSAGAGLPRHTIDLTIEGSDFDRIREGLRAGFVGNVGDVEQKAGLNVLAYESGFEREDVRGALSGSKNGVELVRELVGGGERILNSNARVGRDIVLVNHGLQLVGERPDNKLARSSLGFFLLGTTAHKKNGSGKNDKKFLHLSLLFSV